MDNQASPPLRILLLEDSASDAQLILLQLKRDGLTVECRQVENETDFTAALSWPPDLILSDYSLPHFNGLRALQIAKQHGLDIPFILVSGAVGEDVIVDVIKQGADDYVMKDRLTRLGSAVNNALEQKRLREEKKRSDEALRVSEEHLNLFFTQSLDGFFFMMLDEPVRWDDTVDKDKVIDYVLTHQHVTKINDAMLAQYRATREQFIGLTPADLFAHDLEEGKQAFKKLLDTGHLEIRTDERRFDGTQMWVEGDYVCLYDSERRITGHFGIQRDVTERSQAEEKLRKAEAKFQTLTEQIPPIVYITGLDQHIGVSYVSPRISTLGFTPEEWIADPELWFRQIHPEDQSRVLAEIRESELNNLPIRLEYRIAGRDGSLKWFLDEAINVFDEDGSPLFRQGFMLDITERKQAEGTLASREHHLALLNAMTRNILLSTDFDSTFLTLAFDLKKIINADDCYILRWDEEKQVSFLVTTTANLDFSFSNAAVNVNDLSLISSILQAGHVLAVDDIFNSPYISLEIAKRFPARSIVGVPLIAGEHKLGAAVIAYNTPHHFNSDEIERTEQAGSQVALALWNFQQGIEIQQRLKQSHTLTDIGRALSEIEHGGSERVLQLIVDSALDLIPNAEQAVIHIVTPEEDVLSPMAIAGYTERPEESLQTKMQMGKGVAGQVIRDGITINISNVEEDPRFLRTNEVPKYRSLMVAPIQSSGQQIGTISMQSKLASAFSTEDEKLLNALAIDAAIAIDNTRSFEATQQSLKEVNALYGTIQVLAASLNAEELAKDVVALLQKNFGYYYVQFYLLDSVNADLVIKAGSGEVGEHLLKGQFRMARGTGIIGHVAETGVPFYTNNVNNVVFFERNPLLPDTLFELAVPIKVDQEVVGVLDIQDKPPRQLSQRDLQLVQAVGDQLAVALHKANLYTDLQNAMKQEQSIRSQLIQSERLALVGRLLASVSHELNNPLQAIQNALFLLKEESGLSMQGSQDLGIVLSETERMAALIERLRSAYRPIRGKDFQLVQLNTLIEDVYALIGTHMRHKEIVFEFIPDPDLQPVSGISDQLRQVVLNLFLNAVEVMDPGGRLTVQTQNLIEQNEVSFTVKDTGPGIDDEILPRIFDAFITSKHTGTGLGLTITHDILEQHHGRISAENDSQRGAIFRVWLPMAERESL